MSDKVPMTPEGATRLREELRRLKEVEMPQVVRDIATAREHGDLSENAEYHAAKERQGMIAARTSHIEHSLARAEIIDPSKLSGSRVQFGARVKLANVDSGEEQSFQIVGPEEADAKLGRISVTSPARPRAHRPRARRRGEGEACRPGRAPTRSSTSRTADSRRDVAPSTRAEARLERAPLATELVSRTTDAYFAVVALALGELVLWGLLHRRELVGVFELSRALRGLAPLALVAAFPIALAAGPLIVALLRSQRASARVTLTLTLTLAGAWLGHNLSGGRRASELRTPITLCLGALSGGLAYALGPRVARLALWASGAAPPGARPTPRWAAAAWTLGWLGVVVAVATVNVRVLPRLYPTFHAALTALACVLATLALAPLAARSLVGLSAAATCCS
jgi:transcription elongation factor GreA